MCALKFPTAPPVFPSSGLGYELEKDGSGRARMTSIAAFVQEPN